MRITSLNLRISGCHFYTQQAGLLCRPKHISLRFRMFHQSLDSLSNTRSRWDHPRGIREIVAEPRARSVERPLETTTQNADPGIPRQNARERFWRKTPELDANTLRRIAREREASTKGGTSEEDKTTTTRSPTTPTTTRSPITPSRSPDSHEAALYEPGLHELPMAHKLGFRPWKELIRGALQLGFRFRGADFRKALAEYESWDNPAPRYPLDSKIPYDSGRALHLFQRTWFLQHHLRLTTNRKRPYPNLRFPHHPLPIPSSMKEGDDYGPVLHGNEPPQWHFIFCLARLDPRTPEGKMKKSWERVQNLARRDYFMLHYIDRVRSQQKRGALSILDPLETLTAGLCLPWNLDISLLRGGYEAWRYHHRSWLHRQKREDLDEETVKWLLREDEKDVIVETKIKEPRPGELSKLKRKEFRRIFTEWKDGSEYSKGGLNLTTLFGKQGKSLSEEDALKRYYDHENPGKSFRKSADLRHLEKDKLLIANLDLGTTVKTAKPVDEGKLTKMILQKAVDLDMAIADDEVRSQQDWRLANGHVKGVFRRERLKKKKDCGSTARWRTLVDQSMVNPYAL